MAIYFATEKEIPVDFRKYIDSWIINLLYALLGYPGPNHVLETQENNLLKKIPIDQAKGVSIRSIISIPMVISLQERKCITASQKTFNRHSVDNPSLAGFISVMQQYINGTTPTPQELANIAYSLCCDNQLKQYIRKIIPQTVQLDISAHANFLHNFVLDLIDTFELYTIKNNTRTLVGVRISPFLTVGNIQKKVKQLLSSSPKHTRDKFIIYLVDDSIVPGLIITLNSKVEVRAKPILTIIRKNKTSLYECIKNLVVEINRRQNIQNKSDILALLALSDYAINDKKIGNIKVDPSVNPENLRKLMKKNLMRMGFNSYNDFLKAIFPKWEAEKKRKLHNLAKDESSVGSAVKKTTKTNIADQNNLSAELQDKHEELVAVLADTIGFIPGEEFLQQVVHKADNEKLYQDPETALEKLIKIAKKEVKLRGLN